MNVKDLKKGTGIKLDSLVKTAHDTQPPGNYSENQLIAVLESKGIGRPATYSSIVSLIQDRGYVKKLRGKLIPTPLGFSIVSLLTSKFPQYTDYAYTAAMEEELDEIETGEVTREEFLSDFWFGAEEEEKGFEEFVEELKENIDWDEIKGLSTLDLENGYSLVYNKFGVFLQDDEGELNEKGYLPSVRMDEDTIAMDLLDPEECKKLFAQQKRAVQGVRELGVLPSGEYEGWTVTARTGKYGDYVQAVSPDAEDGARDKKIRPVNHTLKDDLKMETVKLKDVEPLFAEVKLPRWSDDRLWLVGIGKRGGAYMGKKRTPKARKIDFKSLPEEYDPRTVSFEKLKEIFDEL